MQSIRRLRERRLRDASLITIVPAIASGFALNNLLFQAFALLFRQDGFRLPVWNLYIAILAFVCALALLALALRLDDEPGDPMTEQ